MSNGGTGTSVFPSWLHKSGSLPINLSSGLVHYWTMNEASGDRADSVGAFALAENAGPGSVAGKNSNAVSVTGAGFKCIYGTGDIGTAKMSLSLWAKPSIIDDYGCPFGVGDVGGSAKILVATYPGAPAPAGKLALWTENTNLAWTVVAPAVTGEWHHYVLGLDTVAKTAFIAYDGEVLVDKAWTGSGPTIPPITGMAGTLDGVAIENVATAAVDEVGLWNRLLNTAEIADLYNAGAGKFYPFS